MIYSTPVLYLDRELEFSGCFHRTATLPKVTAATQKRRLQATVQYVKACVRFSNFDGEILYIYTRS